MDLRDAIKAFERAFDAWSLSVTLWNCEVRETGELTGSADSARHEREQQRNAAYDAMVRHHDCQFGGTA